MKNTIAILCFFFLSFTSCLEEMDLKYTIDTDPQLVIEGFVTNKQPSCKVYVSESVNMSDSIDSRKINDAIVIISDNIGNSEILTLTDNGIFQSKNIEGKIGRTYKIKVIHNNNTYEAEEIMRNIPKLDSIYIQEIKDNEIYNDGKYLFVKISSSEKDDIFFRTIISENDSVYSEYRDLAIFDSSFSGANTEIAIPYPFETKDTITLATYSITERVYNFLLTYQEFTMGENSLSIAQSQNPPSNISGGCLGYFQVSAIRHDTIVIP